MPTQRGMEMGLFEVKERNVYNPHGRTRITKTTVVTGRGQQYFINRFFMGRVGSNSFPAFKMPGYLTEHLFTSILYICFCFHMFPYVEELGDSFLFGEEFEELAEAGGRADSFRQKSKTINMPAASKV